MISHAIFFLVAFLIFAFLTAVAEGELLHRWQKEKQGAVTKGGKAYGLPSALLVLGLFGSVTFFAYLMAESLQLFISGGI